MTQVRTVACPTCGVPVEWKQESTHRPFCCGRCRLVDLGAWASETYRVAAVDGKPDAGEGPPETNLA